MKQNKKIMQSSNQVDVLADFIKKNSITVKENDKGLKNLLADDTQLSSIILRPKTIYKKLEIFFIYEKTSEYGSLSEVITDVLVQATTDHDKKILRVPIKLLTGNIPLLEKMRSKMTAYQTAYARPRVAALNKSDWDKLELYQDIVHSDYELIRYSIAYEVLKTINSIGKMNIQLLDIGTGLGDCLNTCYELIQANNAHQTIKTLGTDTNEINIQEAKKRFKNKPYRFEVADSKQLETIISKSPDDFIIMTSSGSLTRLVLNNTIEALEILQKAYRLTDQVILGGETEILLTARIAKKIGWKFENIKIPGPRDLYLMNLCQDPRLIPKIKNNHLDLAFHGNPLVVLKKFDIADLNNITSIDLGLAYLKPEEVNEVFSLLKNVQTVYISGLETWRDQINSSDIVINQDTNAYVDNELPDPKQWELKRHSKNFYNRYNLLFTLKDTSKLEKLTQQNEYSLAVDVNGGLAFLSPENLLDNPVANIRKKIAMLEEKAKQEGDDVAIYSLATQLENGIKYLKLDGSYVRRFNYIDLNKSLVCWQQLANKGYDVTDDIIRVQTKIDEQKTSYDILKNSPKSPQDLTKKYQTPL